MTDDNERRTRAIARIERRNIVRRLTEAAPAEINWHALVWGRIERALEAGRNPSIDDLLGAIAADETIPQAVQIYAQRLRSQEVKTTGGLRPRWGVKVKPTGGPRPRWNLNHDAWQFKRDVILIEAFEALRRDLEHRGKDFSDAAVFAEFVRLRCGGKEAWGAMAAEGEDKRWGSETARSRYFEAKGRVDALRDL